MTKEERDKHRWKYFSLAELECMRDSLNDAGNEYRLTDESESMRDQIDEAIENYDG